jgi:prepilin-type N-terminal cleavage/methylation domain-containing protein
MKKTFSKKKSAFSLIELSIVLIVIGLLIAGITGGASLIKSSELRSVMGEARGYAVAVNAFYSQFNALPGDYGTQIVASGVVGNNNSQIEHSSTGTAPLNVAEGVEAWRDLKAIGAIDSTLTYVTGGASNVVPAQAVTTNIPASKVKSSGWAFDYGTGTATASANLQTGQNVVVLTGGVTANTAGNSVVNGTTVAVAAILATDALSIDAKIDDGSPILGKVRGVNVGATTTCVNTTYQVSQTAKTCALSYQVDVNS